MYPIVFQLGLLTVYSFGVFMALAALTAAWVVSAELKRHHLNSELASNIVFAAAVGGAHPARACFLSSKNGKDFLPARGAIFSLAPDLPGTAVFSAAQRLLPGS